MNRPTPVKPDNFFLLLFQALRQRRIPLALRIVSHSLLLVALALVIYGWVIGMQFKHAMQQQAEALGTSLITQTAASATELLKRHGVAMPTAKFNEMLAGAGFLSRCQRTSSRGTFKHFWAVTPRGEEFGKNVVSAQNSRETQPHWYVDRFGALLEHVGMGQKP